VHTQALYMQYLLGICCACNLCMIHHEC
jgi:hypothetical protein